MAEQTGGRAVLTTDRFEEEIDRIFDEDTSYYLVGFQTSNPKADGGFRTVQVKVNRPGVTVRTRSGYWGPTTSAVSVHEERSAAVDLGKSSWTAAGLEPPAGVSLRAIALPIAPADPTGARRDVIVGLVLSVGLPPLTTAATETLTLTRVVYDAAGRAGAPVQERRTIAVQPQATDGQRYEVLSRVSLAPGRYEIGLDAVSSLVGRDAAIRAPVDVPDLTSAALALSGIALGRAAGSTGGLLSDVLPFVPITERDFARGETVRLFLRVFQAAPSRSAVTMRAAAVDAPGRLAFEDEQTLTADAFATGAAPYALTLPLEKLSPGPHLVTVTASTAAGRTARGEVAIRVK
jgi:hypothetical protein